MTADMACPFCGYKAEAEYNILLHMEIYHPEGQSPFVPFQERSGDAAAGNGDDAASEANSEDEHFAECPIDGCDEIVTWAELSDHIDFHGAEEQEASESPRGSIITHENSTHVPHATVQDGVANSSSHRATGDEPQYRSPYPSLNRSLNESPGNHNYRKDKTTGFNTGAGGAIERWKALLDMPTGKKLVGKSPSTNGNSGKKRLGKSELGKHAHEEKMPSWLVSLLKKGQYVSSEGVIPVLQQLLEQSSRTQHAFLCSPAVQHISKLRREGGFCGYRNIQMMSSYIVGAGAPGSEVLHSKIPSIFRIQDHIESAWDKGINAAGRTETGGVKGTRKYIGTPEAQAMFLGLGIPCEAQGYKSTVPGTAEALLLAAVERYFTSVPYDPDVKVRLTDLPPIYFQHRGHSLTIVGFEQHKSGNVELLVFDPMFHDPETITRNIGRKFTSKNPDTSLKLYRRGNKYLKKYHEFEVLRLSPTAGQWG
ncbi:peptidase family C78-domain-containing protein [Xylariaceae sp. FL0016]|nr:peptidase family C78-domain-containing protein [Xylariaceae sp. FL0016]